MKLYTEGISDFKPWSGATDTWSNLQEYDKVDAFEAVLEDIYPDGMSETELNDLLWFEPESVYEWVGLYYNGDTGEVSDEPFSECHYCEKLIDKENMFVDEYDDIWCLTCKKLYYEESDDDNDDEEEGN